MLISLFVNFLEEGADVRETYGQLIHAARQHHDPPMTAKAFADKIDVKPPFVTDLEKGRRLPSLETQKKIKEVLACDEYPELLFDDLAAISNSDSRVVAEDISTFVRKSAAIRNLIRAIQDRHLTAKEIDMIASNIGGTDHDAK